MALESKPLFRPEVIRQQVRSFTLPERVGDAVWKPSNKLLAVAELEAVHEDRGDDARRVLMRRPNEAQMPVMDVAHGGNARHPRLLPQALAQFSDGLDDIHDGVWAAARSANCCCLPRRALGPEAEELARSAHLADALQQ